MTQTKTPEQLAKLAGCSVQNINRYTRVPSRDGLKLVRLANNVIRWDGNAQKLIRRIAESNCNRRLEK
jgi:hypothetical protein